MLSRNIVTQKLMLSEVEVRKRIPYEMSIFKSFKTTEIMTMRITSDF